MHQVSKAYHAVLTVVDGLSKTFGASVPLRHLKPAWYGRFKLGVVQLLLGRAVINL